MYEANANDWSDIRSLFDALVDLPTQEQTRRLAKAKYAPHIIKQTEALLAASREGGILDGIAPGIDRPGRATPYSSLATGQEVGGFTIDSLLGRGGMGEVYLAHRTATDFTQQVALKLLRAEAADHGDMFVRERRLLARLEHPGIARLIDAGIAADGRPYMAMEYVEGQPIDIWCREHEASLDTRLELFRSVCEAVSYAHANLIVHRDIKPSNIIVDKNGKPRLLDFGIAKLLDDTAVIPAATQAMLTPDNAAPEQLEGEEPTVATDVYALGVLLYELVSGKGPWHRDGASVPAIIKRVLYEDPMLPSQAAVKDGLVPPGKIAGDLDAIIMKAMRRVPIERYVSVTALAADVERHEQMIPIEARDGSTRYMLGRFLRRYRWAVGASAAIIIALLVGAGGIAWQARQTTIERDNAFAEASRIDAANQAFMGMFQDASDESRFETTTMRQMIDGTRERLMTSLRPQSPGAAATIVALADLYLTASANDDARSLLTDALAKGFGKSDPADMARLKLQLSTVEIRDNKPAEARRLLDEVQPVWRSNPDRFLREIIITADVESTILWHEGHRKEAIDLLKRNMAGAEKANNAYNRDLVWYYQKLSKFLAEEKRPDEAVAVMQHGLMVLAKRNQAKTNEALLLRRFQADIVAQQGDDATAARMLSAVIVDRRNLYGPSLALAVDLLKLGRLYTKIGKSALALPLLEEAAPMSAQYFGINSDPTFQIALAHTDALAYLSRASEAEKVLASAKAHALRKGTNSVDYGTYLRSRANLYVVERKFDESEAELDKADAIFKSKGSEGDKYMPASTKIRARLNQLRKGAA